MHTRHSRFDNRRPLIAWLWSLVAVIPAYAVGADKPVVPATSALAESRCYRTEQIAVDVAEHSIRIAGDLTRPVGTGPFPVVQMITGTGPHTRDEMISGSSTFAPIAAYLARRGVAVLRSDARGFGASTGKADTEAHTTAERAGDNRALLEYLRAEPQIDAKRIAVFGHSEGAMIAVMLGTSDADLALLILMGPSTLPGAEVLAEQMSSNLARKGADAVSVQSVRRELLRFFQYLASGRDDPAEFAAIADDFLAAHGVARDQLDHKLAQSLLSGFLSSRWDRFFAAYDPADDLARLKVPVAAYLAGEDENVPWRSHLPPLLDGLKRAGLSDFSIDVIPDQDHFFLEYDGKRQVKHRNGEMQVADELLAAIDATLARRGWLQPACKD